MAEDPLQEQSSDDELVPVRRAVKVESLGPEDLDPMKRKHNLVPEVAHIDNEHSSPPKKPRDYGSRKPAAAGEAEADAGLIQNAKDTFEHADDAAEQEDEPAEDEGLVESSPFMVRRASIYVPVSPIYQNYALAGACAEHLSPLILTYYPPFNGVILSYENEYLSNEPQAVEPDVTEPVLARARDEYAASYVWITADFLLFAPRRGDQVEGWVNYQNESFIGLICWNFLNARIPRDRLPPAWTWIGHRRRKKHVDNSQNAEDGDTGFYRDESGQKLNGQLKFWVADVELTADPQREKSLMRIHGTLLDARHEARLRGRNRRRSSGQGDAQ